MTMSTSNGCVQWFHRAIGHASSPFQIHFACGPGRASRPSPPAIVPTPDQTGGGAAPLGVMPRFALGDLGEVELALWDGWATGHCCCPHRWSG